ncbi:hypothetical protein [Novosphingobium sp. M1R2S20]|uniref:Lipoprotein n=1 Tax=Novosphingobium rhizovicinum TaxID=3228928 RepID=A0ABV3RA07_9SPHN
MFIASQVEAWQHLAMPRKTPALLAAIALLSLSGCIARTAVGVVTAPVRVASKAVDLATTSQSEADEKRGREIRRREERVGKLQRSYEKNLRRCEQGSDSACEKARAEYDELQELLPTIPYERR